MEKVKYYYLSSDAQLESAPGQLALWRDFSASSDVFPTLPIRSNWPADILKYVWKRLWYSFKSWIKSWNSSHCCLVSGWSPNLCFFLFLFSHIRSSLDVNIFFTVRFLRTHFLFSPHYRSQIYMLVMIKYTKLSMVFLLSLLKVFTDGSNQFLLSESHF